MSNKIINKLTALSLSAVLLSGTALAASASQLTAANISTLAVTAAAAVTAQTAYTSDGFGYTVRSDGTVSITGYNGRANSVRVPAKVSGRTVTAIGEKAFSGCTSMNEIALPDTVSYIGGFAFENCSSLKSITLPEALQDINGNVFIGCSTLQDINVSAQNRKFTSVGGVLFSKDRTVLYAFPTGRSGAYTVPDTVTRINDYAFGERNKLTKVVIPASVKVIGFNAFEYCAALKKAKLSEGLEDIGTGAFNGCKQLTDVSIPSTVHTLHSFAFAECHSLKTIAVPEGITFLDFSVFEGCYSLRYVKLPTTLRRIYANALGRCTSLESIRLPKNTDKLFGLAFCESRNLRSITILNKNADIDKIAFDHCENLTIYCKPGSTAESYAKSSNIPYSTGTALAADLSTITVGEKSINIKAKAFDGTAPYKFSVYCLKPGAQSFKLIQNYSKNTNITIGAKTHGTYLVRICIKDSTGKITSKEYPVKY